MALLFLTFFFIYRQCWFCEIRYDKINELTPSCGSLLWCCVRSTFYWLRTSIRRGLKNNSKCNKFNVILERLLGVRSEKFVSNVEQRNYFHLTFHCLWDSMLFVSRHIHGKPINYHFGIRFLISDEAKYSF